MRLIAVGSKSLVEGFLLLGFETYTEPTAEQIDDLLAALLRSKETALLFVESAYAHAASPVLARARGEGGRMVLVEVPPLNLPDGYHPDVDQLIRQVLGPSALEMRP